MAEAKTTDANTEEATAAGSNMTEDPSASETTVSETSADQAPVRKKMSRGKKIALWIVGVVVGLVVVVLLGFNIYMRTTYASFFDKAQDEFAIPGTNAGFICQDLDYYDEGGCWFFSGYTSGDGSSPLYRRDADGDATEFFAQLPDGSPYTGHGSGITTSSDYAYLTCDDGYLVFNAADLVAVEAGGEVRAIDQVDLELTPAFMNIENDVLFVGTFHLLPNYAAPDEHHLTAPDGTEQAGIMLAYLPTQLEPDEAGKYGFSTKAAAAYSLPDKVQGMCVFPDGDIVLSTSYGFATSHLLTYRIDTTDAFMATLAANLAREAERETGVAPVVSGTGKEAGTTKDIRDAYEEAKTTGIVDLKTPYTFFVDGRSVPLCFLDSSQLISDVEAPPMIEGIEYHDGRVWISEESASNKYIFGKLYGAGDVYSLSDQAFSE